MFRILCDPSRGSIELYLTEIIRNGSQMEEKKEPTDDTSKDVYSL